MVQKFITDVSTAISNSMTTITSPPSPSQIAECALSHYNDALPRGKGKPQVNREWTVYAAIVAVLHCQPANPDNELDQDASNQIHIDLKDKKNNQYDMWVVSCATGSKCCAILHPNVQSTPKQKDNNRINNPNNSDNENQNWGGGVLHDSHAEVLAKRGFMKVLWTEIQQSLSEILTMSTATTSTPSVNEESTSDSSNPFESENSCHETKNHGNNRKIENSRRLLGLMKFNIPTSSSFCSSPTKKDTNRNDPTNVHFEIREGLNLHMYISDAPCGDAAIYNLEPQFVQNMGDSKGTQSQKQKQKQKLSSTPSIQYSQPNLNFTGAKLVIRDQVDQSHISTILHCHDEQNKKTNNDGFLNDNNNSPSPNDSTQMKKNNENVRVVAREQTQILSALRTKSGRSNLPPHLRSTSMSCSDKLCRWSILGLQGGLLSRWIPIPIVLSSICVSQDRRSFHKNTDEEQDEKDAGQLQALQRAIPNRVKNALEIIEQYQQRKYSEVDLHHVKENNGFVHGNENHNKRKNDNNSRQGNGSSESSFYWNYVKNVQVPKVYLVNETFQQGMAFTQYKKCIDAITEEKTKDLPKDICDLSRSNSTDPDGPQIHHKKKQKVAYAVKSSLKQHEKSQDKLSAIKQRYSPCGISLNWQSYEPYDTKDNSSSKISFENQQRNCNNKGNHYLIKGLELTVGATGLKQKQNQKKNRNQSETQPQQDIIKRFSRLSRYSFLRKAFECKNTLEKISNIHERKNDDEKSNDFKHNECNDAKENVKAGSQPPEQKENSYIFYQEFKREGAPRTLLQVTDILFRGKFDETDYSIVNQTNWNLKMDKFEDTNEINSYLTGPLVGWITSRNSGDFHVVLNTLL